MADAGDDLFLFGDDFEAILDLLDEDEALQEVTFSLGMLLRKCEQVDNCVLDL